MKDVKEKESSGTKKKRPWETFDLYSQEFRPIAINSVPSAIENDDSPASVKDIPKDPQRRKSMEFFRLSKEVSREYRLGGVWMLIKEIFTLK